MLDRMLELGTSFDWITPVMAIIRNIMNGPTHTFLVPDDCGWSEWAIEQMLKDQGVHLWGQMSVEHSIMFTVRRSQAAWAEYLLHREGIPTESHPVRGSAHHSRSKRRKAQSQSFLQSLDSWFDNLA